MYQDPNWDWRTFELERDSAKAHEIDKDVDELDPHLAAFAKHGGKLLIYHGWADQQVAPGSSIEFYKSVMSLSGPEKAAQYFKIVVVLCLWFSLVKKHRAGCSILPNSNKATSPRSKPRQQDSPKTRTPTTFRLGTGFVSIAASTGSPCFL